MNIYNLPFNITRITSFIPLISGNVFISILSIVIIIVIVVLLLKFVLSTFIPRFSLLLMITFISYLIAFTYYVPRYIPHTFVIKTNNTTVVNQKVVSDITSPQNFILIPAFYDRLIYYMAKYKVNESDIYVPYSILLLFLIYYIYGLYGSIKKWAVPVGWIMLFATTLGARGIITASMVYSNILFLNLSLILASILLALVIR